MTIIAVLLTSLLFTVVFVVVLKSRGPWGSGWSFFTVVTLWLTAVSLWIPPAGPLWLGAPWIDLLLTALLVSFVLSATSVLSSAPKQKLATDNHKSALHRTSPGDDDEENSTFERLTDSHAIYNKNKAKVRAEGFLWMLLLCLCALIIIGAS